MCRCIPPSCLCGSSCHFGVPIPQPLWSFSFASTVGPRVILGYPFLNRYGLSLLPSQGQLTFEEDLKWTTGTSGATGESPTLPSTAFPGTCSATDIPIAHIPVHAHDASLVHTVVPVGSDNGPDTPVNSEVLQNSISKKSEESQSVVDSYVVVAGSQVVNSTDSAGTVPARLSSGPESPEQSSVLCHLGWQAPTLPSNGDGPELSGLYTLRADIYMLAKAVALCCKIISLMSRPYKPSYSIRGHELYDRRGQMPTVVGHIDEALTEQTIRSAACTYVLAALLLLPQPRPEVPMQDSNPIVSVPHTPTIDVASHIQTELALADALRSIPLPSSPYQPPVYTEAAAFMLNIECFLHVWGIGDRVVSQDIPPAVEIESDTGSEPISEDEGPLGYQKPPPEFMGGGTIWANRSTVWIIYGQDPDR